MAVKQRIVTGVIAGAGFLALLLAGSFWYSALILLLAIVGYFEFMRLNRVSAGSVPALIGFAGVLYLTMPWELFGAVPPVPYDAFLWIMLLIWFSVTVISQNRVTIDMAALLFLGLAYLGAGFHYMLSTRLLEPNGLFWSLFVFACIWASDSGAYFTGRAFGKRLLWPAISPKKTVEGAVGGIVLAAAAALVFAAVRPELLSYGKAAGLGLAIAVAGQMGDLIQSAYKRVRQVKDTGAILPGHGGVLDRCDSWLIVFPLVHLLGLIPA